MLKANLAVLSSAHWETAGGKAVSPDCRCLLGSLPVLDLLLYSGWHLWRRCLDTCVVMMGRLGVARLWPASEP